MVLPVPWREPEDMIGSRATWAVVVVGAGGYACLQWLGHTYGSTYRERRRPMPGDELVRDGQTVANHAVTIPAPPDRVWPWLAQMGWHRGGWYTARWVDALLFPANRPSAERIMPDAGALRRKIEGGAEALTALPPEAFG